VSGPDPSRADAPPARATAIDASAVAIETSGRIGSVAIARGDDLLHVATFSTALQHAVELMPTIDRLCRQHRVAPTQVSELYVSGGPGSFTGLRIGITVARTLAWAGGVRVVRVPTLDVVAQNALDVSPSPQFVAVLLDAKRQNVFAAVFALDGDRYVATTPARELDPRTFLAGLPPSCAVLGEGVAYHRAAVDSSGLTVLTEPLNRAKAEVVWRLGRLGAATEGYDDPRMLVPIYIRRPEAEEVWERKHAGP